MQDFRFNVSQLVRRRFVMPLFQTIIHPTDFDEPSKEAFHVARGLAQALGARVLVFHVVSPPAVLTQDGRLLRDPKDAQPVDLWPEYRTLQAHTPQVPVQYAVVVGDKADAKQILEAKIRELGAGVLLVMGSHGRTGVSRLLWGSKAEEVVRDVACPVLVVKAPARGAPSLASGAESTAKAKPAGNPERGQAPRERPAKDGGAAPKGS
jgi:nucleotide-binding universal stress UspA family protein